MGNVDELPIGVFDSGLGGLTVLKALRRRLPYENYIYLGDMARLPYGSKSQSVVKEYTRECLQFLVEQKVKAIVVACNTASAMALPELQSEFPVPLFGVIEPGVQAGLRSRKNPEKILVLATQSTVRSEAYLKAFSSADPRVEVEQRACPLLVSLAEEGWFDHELTSAVMERYLSDVEWEQVRTVVLGCTHFPLLEKSFRRVLPVGVALVHGGPLLAEQVAQVLKEKNILGVSGSARVRLLTTDKVGVRLPLLEDWIGTLEEMKVVHIGTAGRMV